MKEVFKKAPKKSADNKIISGVCGGFAEHLEIDAFWVRLLALILIPMTAGFMIIIYIALAIIMETDSRKSTS